MHLLDSGQEFLVTFTILFAVRCLCLEHFVAYLIVEARYDAMHVRHTAVTQFQRVPIKDFVQRVSTRETIINDLNASGFHVKFK